MTLTLDDIRIILGDETFSLMDAEVRNALEANIQDPNFPLNEDQLYALFAEDCEESEEIGEIVYWVKTFSSINLNSEASLSLYV